MNDRYKEDGDYWWYRENDFPKISVQGLEDQYMRRKLRTYLKEVEKAAAYYFQTEGKVLEWLKRKRVKKRKK